MKYLVVEGIGLLACGRNHRCRMIPIMETAQNELPEWQSHKRCNAMLALLKSDGLHAFVQEWEELSGEGLAGWDCRHSLE